MTECNGCGGCCDPVVMPYTHMYARQHPEEFPDDNWRWIDEDLTPIPDHIARKKDPDMYRRLMKGARKAGKTVFFFSCRHYDHETRQCNIYDQRPQICSGYPWRGGKPIRGMELPSACSFNADIGQPVRLTQKPT